MHHLSYTDIQNNPEKALVVSETPTTRTKRPYHMIDNKLRKELLDQYLHGEMSFRKASLALGINYSSAKSVLRTYRTKGRLQKKKAKARKEKKKPKEMGGLPVASPQNIIPNTDLLLNQCYAQLQKPAEISSNAEFSQTCHNHKPIFFFHQYSNLILSSYFEKRNKRLKIKGYSIPDPFHIPKSEYIEEARFYNLNEH